MTRAKPKGGERKMTTLEFLEKRIIPLLWAEMWLVILAVAMAGASIYELRKGPPTIIVQTPEMDTPKVAEPASQQEQNAEPAIAEPEKASALPQKEESRSGHAWVNGRQVW